MLFYIHARHNMVQERDPANMRNEPTEEDDFFDVLDEMTTHRGELRHRTVNVKEDKLYQARYYIPFYVVCN